MAARSGPGCRTGRALAPPEDVARHDEQAVGVQGSTRPDQAGPPPRGCMSGAGVTDDVAVTGEGVLDEDCVVCGRRERPPRLVGDRDVGQHAAPLQLEVADGHELPIALGIAGAPDRRG